LASQLTTILVLRQLIAPFLPSIDGKSIPRSAIILQNKQIQL
jgi:hypothetical protein